VQSRPPTAPILGARPPTAPIQLSSTPPTPAQVPKLLKETEVYVKYGLHDKAQEHLRRIFSVDPDNIDAHEKAKLVALAQGRTDDAMASLTTMLRLCAQKRDPRTEAVRAELKQLGSPAARASAPAERDELVLEEAPLEVETLATESELELETAAAEEEELLEAEPVVEAEPELEEVAEGDDGFAGDLAEADFYIQAGLADDARAILEGITLASPDHPGALARLQKLEGAAPAAPAAASAKDHDDLAAELAAELAEVGMQSVDEDKPLDGDVLESFQVPAQEVLGEFRARLQEVVRPEDVQTHYDLGIAYKEMGLLEEAVAEFDVALRHGGGTRAVDCLTMLGMCELERGNAEAAVGHFQQGLELPDLTAGAGHALRFELGAAFEAQGLAAEALEQYQAVESEDGAFRDVADRVQRLAGSVQVKARPIPKRPSAPAVAPRKLAAQAPSGATAGRGSAEPEPPPEPARKNRKIGFV
jgi:tetratricopeptide (TPR) repeat protein